MPERDHPPSRSARGGSAVVLAALVGLAALSAGPRPEGGGLEPRWPALTAAAAAQDGLSLAEAARMNQAAADGDASVAVELAERLETRLAQQDGGGRERPVILAYLGSATAIQARDGTNPLVRLSQTNRALRYLDEARELAPTDFTVLQIAAGVQTRLPGMFGRREQGVQDMLTLHEIFTADPRPEYARAMQPIYASLAELAPGRGDWSAMADYARARAGRAR